MKLQEQETDSRSTESYANHLPIFVERLQVFDLNFRCLPQECHWIYNQYIFRLKKSIILYYKNKILPSFMSLIFK